MAAVLLDTQALLLWTTEAGDLSGRALRLLDDRRTRAVISSASIWEMAIKQRRGKLRLPEAYFDALFSSDVQILAITERHALAAGRLPLHHADPFDRMLIAQAQAEGIPLVGSDAAFADYDVEVVW
ncbi:MAG: type II toxin-antitoxin system VapC family toxin [Actinomycetota bacterium]|nr:type II toxin-antitoxin system VapC family toxin [Actinomycetota bacterium]